MNGVSIGTIIVFRFSIDWVLSVKALECSLSVSQEAEAGRKVSWKNVFSGGNRVIMFDLSSKRRDFLTGGLSGFFLGGLRLELNRLISLDESMMMCDGLTEINLGFI